MSLSLIVLPLSSDLVEIFIVPICKCHCVGATRFGNFSDLLRILINQQDRVKFTMDTGPKIHLFFIQFIFNSLTLTDIFMSNPIFTQLRIVLQWMLQIIFVSILIQQILMISLIHRLLLFHMFVRLQIVTGCCCVIISWNPSSTPFHNL